MIYTGTFSEGEATSMCHLKKEIFGREVVFRDMVEDDLETIVGYWHDSDPGFLHSLGADLSRLTSREKTRERLQACLNGSVRPFRVYFVIASGTELLAYTNLNFRSESLACAHFHLLKRTFQTKGFMYGLFSEVVEHFFRRFPLEKIEMQTLPENKAIDRLLRRFDLEARRTFVDNPDGFGRPGELNVWELRRPPASSLVFLPSVG